MKGISSGCVVLVQILYDQIKLVNNTFVCESTPQGMSPWLSLCNEAFRCNSVKNAGRYICVGDKSVEEFTPQRNYFLLGGQWCVQMLLRESSCWFAWDWILTVFQSKGDSWLILATNTELDKITTRKSDRLPSREFFLVLPLPISWPKTVPLSPWEIPFPEGTIRTSYSQRSLKTEETVCVCVCTYFKTVDNIMLLFSEISQKDSKVFIINTLELILFFYDNNLEF